MLESCYHFMPIFQIGSLRPSSQFSKRSRERLWLMFAKVIVVEVQQGRRVGVAHVPSQETSLDIPGSGNMYC